jgi:hypothetical protein
LAHGAFADGSGWKPVADILTRDGYTVYVVQEPETTFDADVAATRTPERAEPSAADALFVDPFQVADGVDDVARILTSELTRVIRLEAEARDGGVVVLESQLIIVDELISANRHERHRHL